MHGLVQNNTMDRQINGPAYVNVGPAYIEPVSYGPRCHVRARRVWPGLWRTWWAGTGQTVISFYRDRLGRAAAHPLNK